MPDTTEEQWLPLREIFQHVQALRAKLGLPALRHANSISNRLHPLPKKGTRCAYLYPLSQALKRLTQLKPRHASPWNRLGTPEEITSRQYMPMTAACEAFRVSMHRMTPLIYKLYIKAWRHPVTGARWVNIEQFSYHAQWRSLRFLKRILSPEELDHITSTRPQKTHYHPEAGAVQVTYFAPEYSHIGTQYTAFAPRSTRSRKKRTSTHAS